MANEPRRGLGRGLSALLGEEAAATDAARVMPIDLIDSNPDQPRRAFGDAEIAELTDSIKEKGVLQPILVRPSPLKSGRWQVVAGERRWRAAQAAGLKTIPIVERDMDDGEAMEVAIVENVQRADLTALEEAYAYRTLMDHFGRTQEGVAETVGKSRSHVANTLRLLALPQAVQAELTAGRLTAGHARALIGADDPAALARQIVAEGLNVRQAEALAKKAARGPSAPRAKRIKSADAQAVERDLSQALGLAVTIEDKDGRGQLRIAYQTLEQLDALCRKLMG